MSRRPSECPPTESPEPRTTQFAIPSWMERTHWRVLCNVIPQCLPLYNALRDLADTPLHQEECREVAQLWEIAGKGVDEWERRRNMPANGNGAAVSRPTGMGSHRAVPVPTVRPNDEPSRKIADDALVLLTVAYEGIVQHVDKATTYHFYPFSAAEAQGKRESLLVELQAKAGFKQYTGQKIWENGVPLLSQIYIYGHCEPGVQKLQNDAETKILDSTQLAVRLIASGLGKDFSGRVKIYACHSGMSAHDDAGTEESLAESVATVMRGRGYNACEYFGYTEALRYTNTVQAYAGHKYTFTADNPSYATSLRNPAYFESVVKKTMWSVYAKSTAQQRLDRYDLVLKEVDIRDALEQARNEESSTWYRANEQRASEARSKF